MTIRIDEDNLQAGVMSLVVALVEILHELMRHQAVRRMESGSLTDDQTERLGHALMQIEEVLDRLKTEQGLHDSVRQFRDGLDSLVDNMLNLEEGGTDDSSAVLAS